MKTQDKVKKIVFGHLNQMTKEFKIYLNRYGVNRLPLEIVYAIIDRLKKPIST